LRDEPVLPPHEGVRGGKRSHLFETPATERVGECGEAAALGIGEPQSLRAALSFENAVLLLKVRDHLLLLTLEPTGEHGDEDMQNHGVPRVESRDMLVCSSILTT
jgi:hypothetical protein